MTKKEFDTTEEALVMIVSFDPSTGKSIYDTYDWTELTMWITTFEKDFPKLMHFFKYNNSALEAKKRMFYRN